MWLAAITHWLVGWIKPKPVSPTPLPWVSSYSFIPAALIVDRAAFARPPPVVVS